VVFHVIVLGVGVIIYANKEKQKIRAGLIIGSLLVLIGFAIFGYEYYSNMIEK
jgi:hypothetical protein